MFWEPFVSAHRRLQGGPWSDLNGNVIDMCIRVFHIHHLRLACIFISYDIIIRGVCAVWFQTIDFIKYIFHQDLSVRFWKIRHNLLSWLNAIPNIWKFVLQNESECYFRKFLCRINLEFKVFVSHDTRIKIYFIINALYSLPFLEKNQIYRKIHVASYREPFA